MKALFADTFYWIALTNPNDSRSRQAIQFANLLSGSNDRHFEQEGFRALFRDS